MITVKYVGAGVESELRAIVFSDLHLKNYTRFAEWQENGLTTRAIDCLSIIDDVFREAKQRNIDTIFFTGDLFHDRSKIDVSIFNATYEKFLFYKDSGVSVFFIAGNHDQTSKNEKENSIQLFDNIKNVFVLNNEVFEYKGFDIVGLQATEDKEVLYDVAMRLELENPAILLTHSQITGSSTSSGFKMLNGLPIPELSKRYVGIVCGDIHQFQVINENIIIPGASLQHHFGDKESKKYFLDVTFCMDGIVNVDPIDTKKPEFFSINVDEAKDITDDYNFYSVTCNKILSVDDVDNIRQRIKNVDFVYDVQYESENCDDIGDIVNDHSMLLKSYVSTLDLVFTEEEIFDFAKTFL